MIGLTLKERVIALRLEGVGPREIGRRLHLTNGVVAGVLYRAGMTDVANMGNPPKLTPDDVRAIRRDYRRGVRGAGLKALADRHGVTHMAVKHLLDGVNHRKVL